MWRLYYNVLMLGQIIFFSLAGGVFSLAGGVVLLLRAAWSKRTILTLVSFAAGVMLAVAFEDLLPEAFELAENIGLPSWVVLRWTLSAIVGFFLFERSFVWFHHHHGPHKSHPDPTIAMVMLGDTLHNFLDGVVIAASFLLSFPLGLSTTLAVAAHELPQEIADFSLFLSKGINKKTVLALNVISSLATLVGAVATYFYWGQLAQWQPAMLAFTAGMFIYIAGSDLIPELHDEYRKDIAFLQTLAFLVGVGLTIFLKVAIVE